MLNIFTLTTNKLVEHLKSGQISSVEVCNQYIERIEKFEKDINSNDIIKLVKGIAIKALSSIGAEAISTNFIDNGDLSSKGI